MEPGDEVRRLPGADLAIVEEKKITEYLLALEHPTGGSKAAFFMRFGFRPEAWLVLRAALLRHAREGVAIRETRRTYGVHYTVEGSLHTPDGRDPRVRTVWVVSWGRDRPRLVTSHPGRGGGFT